MEPLPDPCGDRHVTSLPPPPHKALPADLLYPYKEKDRPDWKLVRDFMQKEGSFTKPQCIKMIKDTISVLKKEPNMVKIGEPIVIVGDLHGQYFDFVHMLEKAGDPGDINYLFLGDYVDRGIFGFEVVLLLCAIKLNF